MMAIERKEEVGLKNILIVDTLKNGEIKTEIIGANRKRINRDSGELMNELREKRIPFTLVYIEQTAYIVQRWDDIEPTLWASQRKQFHYNEETNTYKYTYQQGGTLFGYPSINI